MAELSQVSWIKYLKASCRRTQNTFHLDFTSSDNTTIYIDVGLTDTLNKNFDGLKLETYKWEVKPLKVSKVKSSFFEDKTIFPEGTIQFDNAVLMENIEHE